MIIEEHIPKRKKRKPTSKQRQLRDSWNKILEKWEPKKKVAMPKKDLSFVPHYPPGRGSTSHIPSLDTGAGVAAKRDTQHYTGDEMIGIGQMHKSNAVPIFRKQDAEDLAKMRR